MNVSAKITNFANNKHIATVTIFSKWTKQQKRKNRY